jgi:hypothetical protein
MRRGGSLKMRAAALLLGPALAAFCLVSPGALAQDEAAADETAPDEAASDTATTIIVDTGAPIYLYTHDTCRSIFAAAAPDPQGACDCMTPILMQRLTPDARARIEADPDQLPFGAPLFRDATEEEEAAQRACME